MCCKEEVKVMIKNRSGVIINTASMSVSIVNIPQNQTLYNTSKAGVLMLTKCLEFFKLKEPSIENI
ncbi:SDR family NAD(P)-dependent oxidoreductase [candidate division WOR-3 bacterium]|nr:SDR family NAD(P)-dependent oxidoreductase [candidate division WOR-3 bacterium]